MAVAISENAGHPSFGELLSRHRDAAGLTQEELAERSGLSVVTISALERGVRRAPYRDTVSLLAGALELRDAARREFEDAADNGRSRSVRAGPEVGTTAYKLPWHLTSFIGRSQEIAELDELMREHRLVTVIGSGGIGKTRTALKVAERVAVSRRSEVVFVDFAPLSDGVSVPSRIAGTIGVRSTGQADALTELVKAVCARSLLLIFDNCEHVIDAAGLAAARLLEDCPAITVLATSRERLRIGGEVAYRLPALPVPGKQMRITAAGGLSFAAMQLFVERATAVDPRFRLTDDNARTIADICYRVDGIPLAIELAAARVPTLGLSVLRSRLNDHFNILAGNRRDAPDRQQTLFKTIAWSHELLAASEQILLRRLTIFIGGWTLEAAEGVCSDAILPATVIADALPSLVEKCLVVVEVDKEPIRYRLLESTRSFAQYRASQAGESELLADRHLAYYRNLFQTSGDEYVDTIRHSILTELERELDNGRAAIDWSIASGDATSGAELFVATYLWYYCGLHNEEIARAERLLDSIPADDNRLRSLLLGKVAMAAFNTLQHERGMALSRSSVDAARQSGDAVALATALGRIAMCASSLGQLPEARQALADCAVALDEAERMGVPTSHYRGSSLEVLGRLAAAEGDFGTAIAMFDRLARLLRSVGNRYAEMVAILNCAELEHERGDTAKAIVMLTETLSDAKQDPHKGIYANLLIYVAAFRAAANDTDGARGAAREAIALLAETGDNGMAFAIQIIALVLALENKPNIACQLAGYSSALIASAGLNLGVTGQRTYDRLSALLLEHYDPSELAERLAAGTKLTPEEAKARALMS